MGFSSSSEVAQAPSSRPELLVTQKLRHLVFQASTGDASLEVFTPSAFSRFRQRHELVGPASPDRLRL